MDFYSSISCYYDEIFPLKESQVKFVESYINGKEDLIVDAGCGTGNLVEALAQENISAIGVDLDVEMIKTAKLKTASKDRYHVCSLQNINNVIKNKGSVSVITCLGNTLVHLNSQEKTEKFIKNCYNMLKPGGSLVIQILNYDYILSKKLPQLPLIETDNIKFDRFYNYTDDSRHIDFKGVLTLKQEEKIIENTIKLYPIRKQEIIHKVTDSGFSNYELFGNFRKEPLHRNSLPLILVATK